jgi:hypothetical protein
VRRDERPSVEELVEAILRKLNANKDVLARSLDGGSLDWDWTRNGVFRVKLKPRI